MTTADGPVASGPPLRIGTDERTSAMKALDEHLTAGRLGVEEYADRSALAAAATVGSELAALFTDLPAPHPQLPGSAPARFSPLTAPMPAVQEAGLPVRRSGALDGWGPRAVAVMPFVALILFFTTGLWYWFLLIPAAGALVYGSGLGRSRAGGGRDRDRRRDRR